MLGQNTPNGVSNWDFDKVRCFLISKSAGFKLVINRLRSKHKLIRLDARQITVSAMEGGSGLSHDVSLVAEMLNVTRDFIEFALQFNSNIPEERLNRAYLPIYMATSAHTLPEGFYIKVEDYTRLEVVKKTYKLIHFEQQQLNNYIDKTKSSGYKTSLRNKKLPKLAFLVDSFIEIEKTIFSRIKGKEENLINAALEFVAEELCQKKLVKSKNYGVEFPKTQDRYYKVLRYYRLPTFKEYEDLLIKVA